MRITQVMLSEGWGGAERLFIELCIGLAKAGHELQVICRPDFTRGQELARIPGISYSTLPARGAWDLWSLWMMQRKIAAFHPEILHAHLIRATWMTGIIGKWLKIPTLATTHNQIKAKYFRKIDYFSTITRSLRHYLRQEGVEAERIRHIPNFSLFIPVDAPTLIERQPPVFISLGRFVAKKGYAILVEAFALLVKEIGPARLLIAGSGAQEEILKRRVAELGLNGQVIFLGWVEDTETFFAQGDIFVLPSLNEPFGIVLLEAMAKGKAIVTTRTGGPLDLLDESQAYFVATGDVADLVRGMRTAANDPAGCFTRATQCLELYRSHYTLDAVLPAFVEFYEYIAGRHLSPAALPVIK